MLSVSTMTAFPGRGSDVCRRCPGAGIQVGPPRTSLSGNGSFCEWAEVAFAQVVELMMKSSGRTRCTVLEAPPDGVGTKFRYECRLLGHGIGGSCTLTEYVPNTTATFQWHGPERLAVGDLRSVWAFTPDDGGTPITVRSIFEPRIPSCTPWQHGR